MATSSFPWDSLEASARLYYRASSAERHEIVKHGVPAVYVETLSRGMDSTVSAVCRLVGITRSTIYRKLRSNSRLGQNTGEQIMWVAHLIGQVERIVSESGDPCGFDAASWVAGWLDQAHPALGNRRPADYFGTAEGRDLISSLVAQQQSSSYA